MLPSFVERPIFIVYPETIPTILGELVFIPELWVEFTVPLLDGWLEN